MVQPWEVAAAVTHLIATTEGVTFNGVQEQAAVQVVGNLTFTVLRHAVGVVTVAEVSRVVRIFTVITAVEITQVGFQHARADRPVVNQAQEVLFVELVQVAVVVLQQQVFGDFVIGASVDELVAVGGASARAPNRHLFIVAGVTAFNVFDLTTDQGQVLELVGGDLATFKGLRQQTTIVVGDDRQFRHQGAVTQFGLGNLGFGGQAQAGEVIDCTTVAVGRKHRAPVVCAVPITVAAFTGIKANAQ